MSQFSKPVKSFAFVVSVLTISLSLAYFVLAWTEPTAAPPVGNVSTPLNISATSQTKSGALSVSTLYDTNNTSYFIDPSAAVSGTFAGNVGIGTTSPGAKLEVRSIDDILTTKIISARSNNLTAVASLTWNGLDVSNTIPGNAANVFRVNGTEYMRIMPDGRVGIGTIGPQRKVQIAGDGGLLITSGTDANSTYLILDGVSPGSTYADIRAWDNDFGPRNIAMNAPGGNVGIGTTSPGAKLGIAGNIKIADGTQGAGKVLTSDASGLASWQAASGGGVPSGAVMSFNLASCPSGWTELTSARGRYIVGRLPNGTLAGTVGTALSNLENRPVGQHAHGITGNWGNWYRCPSRPSAVDYCYSTTGMGTDSAGSVAGTNAPYIQLLTCQKN